MIRNIAELMHIWWCPCGVGRTALSILRNGWVTEECDVDSVNIIRIIAELMPIWYGFCKYYQSSFHAVEENCHLKMEDEERLMTAA